MTRQTISITEPNELWLKAQLASKEYASKSEIINDLIRRARSQQAEAEIEFIRNTLIQSEQSGFTEKTPQHMLAAFKTQINNDAL
ncbi:MAG: CopG family transcriptional regulator [Alphaproteobacteria bacterium]|nr:MAG: CopG family transcriptional regulator [Alphaproteobacteria bacterium]TAF41728.1 MAG: CopG family transcriptional regulator [Alphaproteobacteria bacterium]TAF75687.1 MAG: CopG family transcriptional regulator [Alphaproteobacteria bacterium]